MKNPDNNLFELLNLSGRKAYWSQGFKGQGVKVAVIGTGIWKDHKEFKGVNVTQKSVINSIPKVGSHDTAVASLIVGQKLGVAPQAELLGIEITDDKTQPFNDKISEAIILAVDEGCDLISVSYSHHATYGGLQQAVEYAESHNVLVVASSGNDGEEVPRYPASFPSVVSVGGVNYEMGKLKWASYGDKMDVCQIANNVLVASTQSINDYTLLSGTSFSTPIVAGIAALLICKHKHFNEGEKMPVEILRYILKNQLCKDLGIKGKDKYFGYGFCSLQPINDRRVFYIGSPIVEINGERITMETGSRIENGRTLVPLRYANDMASVLWYGSGEVRVIY